MGFSTGCFVFRFSLCIGIALVAVAGFAQTPQEIIASAEWFERPVAPGITWRHYHFDDLFDSQQDIYVTDVDLNEPGVTVRFPYDPSGSRRQVSFFATHTPDAAVLINGNFGGSWGSSQFFRVDGTLVNPTLDETIADEGAIVIDDSENLSLMVRPAEDWESLTEPQVMASNTMVIESGAQWPNWPPGSSFYFKHRNPRTLVGHTADNHFLMVVVDGRTSTSAGMTYEELATTMIALGCEDSLGLDGGGSATMWVRGEPGNSVVNYPSQGGERVVPNAVAVITSGEVAPLEWDARFVGVSDYDNTMLSGDTQTVWMEFENFGTTTWTSSTVLGTTEDRDRASDFHAAGDWISTSRVTTMDQASVAPGETARFTFDITAPDVGVSTDFRESFGVVDGGSQWIGPEQSRLNITVLPPTGLEGTIIIESRVGGQNHSLYSEIGGWADSSANCDAIGMTPGIGQRYGSTYRSIAGDKQALFTPIIPQAGEYNVYVTWGAASNRQSPITYKVHHRDGVTEHLVDQAATANVWYPLGRYHFDAGSSGYVEVSNEDIDISGSMFACAAIFEPIPPEPSAIAVW